MKMMKSTTGGAHCKACTHNACAHPHTTTAFEFVTTYAYSASKLSREDARSEEEKAIMKCVGS